MQIILAVDEADIGQVKAGQMVSFGVDAFPDRQYKGSVQQVRLSATNTNNVITYPVVVAVDNSDRSLLPGMTANAEIEVSRRSDVLRVPNSALRFKPADEDSADAQAPPQGPRAGAGMGDELPKLAQSLRLDARQQAAFDAALSAMKQRAAARRSTPPAAAPSSGASLFGGRGGQQRRSGGGDSANQGAMRQRMLERMTQQFAAFRARLTPAQQQQWDGAIAALASARRAPLYLLVDGKPKQVTVRIGASDGTNTEVSGDIHAGDQVIIGAERATPAP
jgi:HlyD family secretion protein